MTDTAKLMIEAATPHGYPVNFAGYKISLTRALRALHAAGPSNGMFHARPENATRVLANSTWQAMLAQLIAEIGQAE